MIEDWIKEGKKDKCYALLIASDDFEYEIYPVYIKTKKQYERTYEEHNNYSQMRSVKEVILLNEGSDKK